MVSSAKNLTAGWIAAALSPLLILLWAGLAQAQTDQPALKLSKNGGTDSFTVRLSSQPTANVTVTVQAGNGRGGTALVSAGTGSTPAGTATLTFTRQNYATAQMVTVTGVDDDIDNFRQAVATPSAC